jgi:hypothetical protein
MGITNEKLKTREEIENKILEIFNLEKRTGNKNLKESRISPRRQGKIRALKWVLGLIKEI